ncbi:MAG: hypothetical protein ACYC9L_16940 [Sulfuricaulis sp.]
MAVLSGFYVRTRQVSIPLSDTNYLSTIDGASAVMWTKDGSWHPEMPNHPTDLIQAPQRHVRWVNCYNYRNSGGAAYATREEADFHADNLFRIACIRVEFTEGEGLDQK